DHNYPHDRADVLCNRHERPAPQQLVVWAGAQTPIPENFNPFAPEVQHLAMGGIYETLFYYNNVSDVEPAPLLGTDLQFSEDGKSLTITIRDDVTWSDGEPFSV